MIKHCLSVMLKTVFAACILANLARAESANDKDKPFVFAGREYVSERAFIDSGRYCATLHDDAKIEEAERDFRSRMSNMRAGDLAAAAVVRNIPVYFHVLQSKSAPSGRISDQMIRDQIALLNKEFGGTGISFKLSRINRVDNDNWYTRVAPGTTAEKNMKAELHEGGKGTLNIYTASLDDDILGWSSFPKEYAEHKLMDGVVIHNTTLPGGADTHYGFGDVAIHEVGHWLGLYHTFQGGCSDTNDSVSDTPRERSPASGCPTGRDTCNTPGLDPIHNFMDYTNPKCMTSFTNGQRERIKKQLITYR